MITLDLILTITADNGKGTKNKGRQFEFHKKIASKLNILFYFARQCHSVKIGSNENLNGFIRQYFNKWIDFTELTNKQTNKQTQEVEDKLNNRPRKRFVYLSPFEQ